MIRLALSCVWICAVTLGATYFGANWKTSSDQGKMAAAKVEHLEHKTTQPISVPMIADGAVSGYVVAQFVYLIDSEALKQLSVPPDAFITDEAFKKLYVERVDFGHLEKYDVAALTKDLLQKVNQRLGGDVVKDILVDEFNYVSKNEISK